MILIYLVCGSYAWNPEDASSEQLRGTRPHSDGGYMKFNTVIFSLIGCASYLTDIVAPTVMGYNKATATAKERFLL